MAVRSVRMLTASPVLLFMLCGSDERGVTDTQTQLRSVPLPERMSGCGTGLSPGRATDSGTGAFPARRPPPRAPKTRENAMFGMPTSATGAR